MGATFSCEEQEAVVGRLVNAAMAQQKGELLEIKQELQATRAELDRVVRTGGSADRHDAPEASEAPVVVVGQAEKAEAVESITYGEAFEAIGGASELRRYAAGLRGAEGLLDAARQPALHQVARRALRSGERRPREVRRCRAGAGDRDGRLCRCAAGEGGGARAHEGAL